ncbi:DUF4062 domain-containing protein [Caballeronia zhejiangensis]|uniref:DUF4062 domain-containing protein n=1 Tax=Caballeronia zhejiangensis TaxID=871203 RepID=UPI001FD51CA4|nr:DUF4062 domain-containing protein [Caballeronia zhejiangensis]
MAKPRIFLSSTYYDLYQSREDIERFVRSLGYDCIRHETGAIPYTRDARLEASAYREIELCDMLVTIIGGKFGTESKDVAGASITQNEIMRALEKGIQVYIFVEQNTLTEYHIWKINKDNASMKYRYADDPRIYVFLDQLHALPQNNPITGFKTVADVTSFLQDQWAGLFQRYLSQQQRATELSLIQDMKGVAATLKEMVDYLSASHQDKDEALKSIISFNNPVFHRLAQITKTPYRVFFTNHDEMSAWLAVRGYAAQDSTFHSEDSVEEWFREKAGWIEFKRAIFDDRGDLLRFSPSGWSDDWIQFRPAETQKAAFADDDDIPF